MKKFLCFIPFFFLLSSCLNIRGTNFEQGNLWKVSSISGKESYIFGTIHLYPRNEIELSEVIISRLKSCNVLALERDMTNRMEQQNFMPLEMPIFIEESYRIVVSEYGNELVSMENQLIQIANDNGKKITGLESTEEILAIIAEVNHFEIPELNWHKDRILETYHQSLRIYKDQHLRVFKDSLKAQMGEKITNTIVDQRNVNWFKDIILLIEKDKTFIAVGMEHLGGKNGLLSLLLEKRYKLTRVE
ncbi:MAG: TraB/GumN family protein [Bacteroidota bacterium]